jgi:nicotinate-nucleotide pyrophosphorylase
MYPPSHSLSPEYADVLPLHEVIIEASGGIVLDTIAQYHAPSPAQRFLLQTCRYAVQNVDIISVGSLTQVKRCVVAQQRV